MEETKRMTAKELERSLKVDYLVASNLIKLLVSQGKARAVDKICGKGKPSVVYELPKTVILELF